MQGIDTNMTLLFSFGQVRPHHHRAISDLKLESNMELSLIIQPSRQHTWLLRASCAV